MDTDEPANILLGRLTAKVVMLESATALLLGYALSSQPDPLTALAAFESAMDRRLKDFPPNWPEYATASAADTANNLIRQGQLFLDKMEEAQAGD